MAAHPTNQPEQDAAHETVLLNEAVAALVVNPEGCYVDGTFGRGGHSGAILDKLSPAGCLMAIDKDPEALRDAEKYIEDKRFSIKNGSFAQLREFVSAQGWQGKLDGVLLDLGVSSPQLDQAERGFSFQNDGPLDMRMDPQNGISAAQWLAKAEADEIFRVIRQYGEERFARRIARAVVETREERPITTTGQLADLVAEAVPTREKKKHPATRTFQAIRIHINNELGDLQDLLDEVLDVLADGGRLVVISFHSLEDRIVKQFIRKCEKGDQPPAYIPITHDQIKQKMRRVGKAIRASEQEVSVNPRSRSAIMRVAEKVG